MLQVAFHINSHEIFSRLANLFGLSKILISSSLIFSVIESNSLAFSVYNIFFCGRMSATPASLIEAALTVAAAAAGATSNGTSATSTTSTSTTLKPNTNYVVQMKSPSVSQEPLDPLLHVGDGIFLQTKTAQVLAGVFVWAALFVTCQQVGTR